jgi:hypothetical protein
MRGDEMPQSKMRHLNIDGMKRIGVKNCRRRDETWMINTA